MNNALDILAVILIIAWAVGFFVFHAGWLIHALLVIALITIIVKIVSGKQLL